MKGEVKAEFRHPAQNFDPALLPMLEQRKRPDERSRRQSQNHSSQYTIGRMPHQPSQPFFFGKLHLALPDQRLGSFSVA
jgi:hypothetical protein